MASAMGGASANSQMSVRPPDKGSFPLDHFQECKEQMTKYLSCVQKTKDHASCKEFTKAYLTCRMEHGLMAKEDLERFGLNVDVDIQGSKEAQQRHQDAIGRRYEDGFVAGMAKGYKPAS